MSVTPDTGERGRAHGRSSVGESGDGVAAAEATGKIAADAHYEQEQETPGAG